MLQSLSLEHEQEKKGKIEKGEDLYKMLAVFTFYY